MTNEEEFINLNNVDRELTEDEQNLLAYTNTVVTARTQLILSVYAEALQKRYNIVKSKIDSNIANAKAKGKKNARMKEYDRGYLDAFKELYTVLLENIAGEYEAQYVENELEIAPDDYNIFEENN